MKTLYLVRHAKSSWDDPNIPDIDRPLNKRGKRDAPAMGELLKSMDVKPETMISSPANRAKTTAHLIAEQLDYPPGNIAIQFSIYLAGLYDLYRVINAVDGRYNRIMLFGHNPGFTSFANSMTDHFIDNIPTCGVVCIKFKEIEWSEITEGSGLFEFFEYPKKHI